MQLTSDQKTLGIALAAAIGASVTTAAFVDGDTTIIERDAKPERAPADAPSKPQASRPRSPHEVDTAAYAAAIAQLRAQCSGPCTDLLSPPVEPGKSVTTGANFPRGARLVEVTLTGPSLDAFSAPTWTCADHDDATWCEVTATNTSASTLRLTAMVEYEVAP